MVEYLLYATDRRMVVVASWRGYNDRTVFFTAGCDGSAHGGLFWFPRLVRHDPVIVCYDYVGCQGTFS
jgi:hypothetical protein